MNQSAITALCRRFPPIRAGMVLALLFAWSVSARQYTIRNFRQEEGIPQAYIYALIQDHAGYLWAGTGNGLVRFNGRSFEVFTVKDSLADNFVSAAASDGKNVWFGHMNGLCTQFNGQEFRKVILPESGGSAITHMVTGAGGNTWVSTYNDGIYVLPSGREAIKHYTSGAALSIETFVFRDENTLLAGTPEGLVQCTLTPQTRIADVRVIPGIPADKVVDIESAGGKAWYVATENKGIYYYDGSTRAVFLWKPEFFGTEMPAIQDILRDNHENLWIATFGQGLVQLPVLSGKPNRRSIRAERLTGLEAADIKVLCLDREGHLWTGNYGTGLTQILPRLFTVTRPGNSEYGNAVFSVKSSGDFRWIGTERGLLQLDRRSGRVLTFYGPPRLPADTVTAICVRNEHDLWIGTGRHGTWRLDPATGALTRFPLGDEQLENSITSLEMQGDAVWAGTKNGLCRVMLPAGTTRWYTIGQGGLPHNRINCILAGKDGKVWVTLHSNILVTFEGERMKKIPVSGNGNLELGPLAEDGAGGIWAGSLGGGLFRVAGDTLVNLSEKQGLFSSYCYSLSFVTGGYLWVGHRGGLSRVSMNELSVKPYNQFKNRPDGLNLLPMAAEEDLEGVLWFGSDQGLVRYDPAMENSLSVPPALGITAIHINGEEWPVSRKIVLPPGNYRIRFDFIGISLESPELVSYQVQMEGYDQASETTRNTHVTFNHLTEGRYEFSVRAVSGNGAFTPVPLSVQILIKTPVWKKAWFYLLLLTLTGILVFGYIRRKEYKHLEEKKILEEKVEERTVEIQRQRDAIAQQRDMIRQKNVSITSSISYASHIQEAILPSLDMFLTLLPESFIFSRPRDIVSGDFHWIAESKNKVVFAVGDCTGHGVPGAFLSILGITLLNELVNLEGITRSDLLINRFQGKLANALRHTGSEYMASDGIDISLCVIDRESYRIQFTGAMNDLVFIRHNQLDVLRANRITVSSGFDEPELFTQQEFEYRKGDMIYLYSDGYPDQFGGPRDKKFTSRRMHALMLEIAELPMDEQRQLLSRRLEEWMKGYSQTDDITVMGVRL